MDISPCTHHRFDINTRWPYLPIDRGFSQWRQKAMNYNSYHLDRVESRLGIIRYQQYFDHLDSITRKSQYSCTKLSLRVLCLYAVTISSKYVNVSVALKLMIQYLTHFADRKKRTFRMTFVAVCRYTNVFFLHFIMSSFRVHRLIIFLLWNLYIMAMVWFDD